MLNTKSTDNQHISYWGFKRQRVSRDKPRELGESAMSLQGGVVVRAQVPRSTRLRERAADVGASDSSCEAPNQRGAKHWRYSDNGRMKLMFTHSKGEGQKTTKLDRISKKAATQKDTVFNNLGHVVDLDLLRESTG